MNELISVNFNNDNLTVSGRELHEKLRIETPYKQWFDRMTEYGFFEGTDFCTNLCESTGGRPSTDHQLTIDMAKQLCMIQRTDIGRKFREYFIAIENQWNTPEAVMARALRMAEKQLNSLILANSQLTAEAQLMRPKADYFDALVERKLLTSFRETAKQLGIKERDFIDALMEYRYIYRDKKGKLAAYAEKNDGLFELKECFNEKTNWSGTQTLITPKGRETFRLLCKTGQYHDEE